MYRCELLIWFHEPIPTECPKCGQNTLVKLFGVPINSELKTVGSIADRNAEKLTEQQKKDLIEKHRTKNNQQKVLNTSKGWRQREK